MNYCIREEKKEDFLLIYQFIKKAFKTAKVSDGDEQQYAEKLRKSSGYINELALVAEDEDKNIIGHIMFTETFIVSENNMKIKTLLVAPLSVELKHRGKGIGAELIEKGIQKAIKLGYKHAFLCGAPNYYNRFGFIETIPNFNIKCSIDIPQMYFLGREFYSSSLKNIEGKVIIP